MTLINTGCLIIILNALFPKPASTLLSSSLALIFFLKIKPSYLITGYFSTLPVLSFLYKVLILLFIAIHRVTSCWWPLQTYGWCGHSSAQNEVKCGKRTAAVRKRTTLLSRINLENTTTKKKCGNKAVGKRSLITGEQFGSNLQTKNNNFLFPLTVWAVNLALSFLAARSKLKDTKCFLSQYSKTKFCQLPVNYTIEDTGKGVELFWGELEITRSLRGMGVWLSRIRIARTQEITR